MEKKSYVSPEMEIVEFETEDVIEGSGGYNTSCEQCHDIQT